jgi:hypothetical protein
LLGSTGIESRKELRVNSAVDEYVCSVGKRGTCRKLDATGLKKQCGCHGVTEMRGRRGFVKW